MRARDVHSSTRCFWTASRRLSSRGGRERLGLPFQDCCEPDARWVCMSCVPTRSSERSILGRLRWVTRQCGVCDDARTHARTRAPAQRTAADAVMRSVPRALDFAQDRSARGRHGARVRARDVLFRGHRAARKDLHPHALAPVAELLPRARKSISRAHILAATEAATGHRCARLFEGVNRGSWQQQQRSSSSFSAAAAAQRNGAVSQSVTLFVAAGDASCHITARARATSPTA